MRNNALGMLLGVLLVACGQQAADAPTPDDDVINPSTTLGKGQPGVVGTAGIEAWDKLVATEKNRIKGWNTLFLHQSVGQDLEEGCKANGFRFEYYGAGDKATKGLHGGIFVDVGGIANGNAFEKIRVFKENVLTNKEVLKIAILKFGYADISDNNYTQVQTEYKKAIDELRSQVKDLRFVHVTPPLVFSTATYEGNAAKMKVAQWMRDTFRATDVIFDLQALESNDGTCQQNNVWRICTENRNTAADPSEVNGVDSSDGQGHLGKKAAQRISKALLMSIYNAGK